ncbi:amidase [Mycolicibacterium smegmatis]|uniref:amidase n=1 Tax=Mycolicibacterium smegmatis TaxID=1772 RepID=UPI001E32FDD5|nr:amidase [Mycolicibacterium smegmatis]UGU29391.1 amidase [Mycolicibacterium smegmatis]ULN70351.1 amidase [Mycolicibacterium smegmatis]
MSTDTTHADKTGADHCSEPEPLHYRDATELAALIAAGEVSSREVVQAHLDRIAEVNTPINAIVTLLADEALRAADAADAAVAAGADLGPLHGVPVTVKDSIETGGVPTQRGSKLFAGFIPDADASAVARVKAAGAIVLAKTNLPEFSAWTETDNLLTGRTNNPWDLSRTPGGSSGGESAAIAAGMSPIGIGSDVAISVRGPAAFTGIAALKATHGRIPFTGHFAPMTSAWFHIGPMARTVRDIALGSSILSGPDGIDGYAVYPNEFDASRDRIAGQSLRIGWVSDAAFGPVDPEITAAVVDAAKRLADLGCQVEQVDAQFLKDADSLNSVLTFYYGQLLPYLRPLASGREGDLSAIGSALLARDDPSAEQIRAARAQQEQLRASFAGYFRDFDVFLCPVTPMTAPRHRELDLRIDGGTVPRTHVMDATSPFNLTGLPALSIPYGLSTEHLPIGVQLVSKWFDESTILRLGVLLERRGGLGDSRPPIA